MAETHPQVIRISQAAYDELNEAAEARLMKVPELASRLIRAGVERLPEPQPLEDD